MKAKLQIVLRYFSKFGYKPTLEEVYTFFPIKISKNRLKSYLDKEYRYTVGGYRNKFKVQSSKFKISLTKIARVGKYLNFISRFPQIRLIGLSGSVAMLNAKETDDVDLFIISAKNRIWTVRFIVIINAWLLGLKRSREEKDASNKVCLNLFFSESSLKIDKKLQTEYMAHEVLQMMPIMDSNKTYRRFLHHNDWILKFFPNVQLKRYYPDHTSLIKCGLKTEGAFSLGVIGNGIEFILKALQLSYMSDPQGDEQIKKGQLWFHPRDYGRIVGE